MSIITLFKLAWKNFRQRTIRNLLVAFGFSIGLTGILISLGLGNGITQFINQGIQEGSVPQQITIINSPDSGNNFLLEKDKENLIHTIGQENIDYFEMPTSLNLTSVNILGKDLQQNEQNSSKSYFQISQELSEKRIKTDYRNENKILAKDPNDSEGIIVPKTFLDDFNEANKTSYTSQDLIGRQITLNLYQRESTEDKTGTYKTKIIEVYNDDSSLEGDKMFLTVSQTNDLLKTTGFKPQITSATVQLKDINQINEIVEKINASKKYTAITFTGIIDLVKQFIQIIQGLLIAMSSQAIFVSTLLLGIVLYINAIERTKEIGIMKAMGYRNSYIFYLFIFEAIVISLMAIVFALVFSSLIGFAINQFAVSKSEELKEIFSPPITGTLLTILGALLIGCIGSLIPARKAARLNTVDALRYE